MQLSKNLPSIDKINQSTNHSFKFLNPYESKNVCHPEFQKKKHDIKFKPEMITDSLSKNQNKKIPPQNSNPIPANTSTTTSISPLDQSQEKEILLFLKVLKKCNSKKGLRKIIFGMSEICARMVHFYMTECFIWDIFTRKLKSKSFLLSKRALLFEMFKNPDLLELDCHFDNNLLKNYCTGMANFFLKHLRCVLSHLYGNRIAPNKGNFFWDFRFKKK
jgi:hypothetical protein